jgi:hypothetical protein
MAKKQKEELGIDLEYEISRLNRINERLEHEIEATYKRGYDDGFRRGRAEEVYNDKGNDESLLYWEDGD